MMDQLPAKPTRRYRMQRRADRQAQTRQRVVDAVLALHGEVGPAFTTISAIAERAGVERMTVYRYFPDDFSLFSACGARFHEVYPDPDPASWQDIADPVERLHVALTAVYAYHEATEAIQGNSRRDAPRLPALQQVVASYAHRWIAVAASLREGWDPSVQQSELFRAILGHALDFTTWRDLVRVRGLNTKQAIVLTVRLVTCAAQE
jgi:AcrR family transcriptional regulator